MTQSASRHRISVRAPYRLDLTVSALRRLRTNVVDVLTPDGSYVRALAGLHGAVVVCVRQTGPASLTVMLEGDRRDRNEALVLVKRILGVDRELAHFETAAQHI